MPHPDRLFMLLTTVHQSHWHRTPCLLTKHEGYNLWTTL